MKKLLLLLSFICVAQVNAQLLFSVAGNGTSGYSGDGGTATSAAFTDPRGVAIDPSGNIYITSAGDNRIRKINTWGIITTVAGNGYGYGLYVGGGYSGDGGPATDAELNNPTGIACDAAGNVFFTDYGNHRVRKINSAGIITTVVGNGYKGYGGDGGQAVNASLNFPSSIVFDTQGNMYIADQDNYRIRKVDITGIITTIGGTGTSGYTGDGGSALSAQISDPEGITVDAGGNVYFTDRYNSVLRRISNTGIISTVAGNESLTFNGDNIPATSAQLNQPLGLCTDGAGNIYCVNYGYNRVRKIDVYGNITTVAGNGSYAYSGEGTPATWTGLWSPKAVACDNAGRLFVTDGGNGRIRMTTIPITVTANSATMCTNNPATLTANGADTYNWFPPTGLSADTGASVIANPTVTTSYTVTGTKNNALYGVNAASTGTTVVTVVVNATPTINLTGNAFSICSGSSQTFTASSASTYTWAPATTLDNANIANPTASPSTTTVYSVTTSAANGCTTTQTVTLTVIPVPTLSVASNSYTICAGNSAMLNASGSNTYTWAPTADLNNANLANPAASPTTTTVYTVTSTNACGVGIPQTVTVNVNANTLPIITIAANHDTICAGQQTATLTASGANSYVWSTGAASASISPSPTVTTNYLVTGTDANGCTNTDSVKVIVNPLPTISVSSGIICSATSTTICASGASTYTWSPSNHIGSCLTTSVNATYTIQGTDANGCINTKITTTQVVSNPTVSVYGTVSSVCTQTYAAFYSNVSPSRNGITYQWNFGDGVTQPVGSATASYTYTNPNASYTVSLTATDANGCKSIAKTTIKVNPTPTVGISLVGYTSSMCLSTCTTANPSSTTSVNTYTWNLDNNGPLVNVANAYYCSTHSGLSVITLTVTDVNNCIGVGTKSLTVYASPTVTIANPGYTICPGATATICASGANTYTWTPSNYIGSCLSTVTPGNYTVQGTDANGCNSFVTSTNLQVAPNPTVSISAAPLNCSSLCEVFQPTASTSSATYLWDFGDGPASAGSASPSHCYSVPGSYNASLVLTDGNGCVGTATTNVNVNPTAPINLSVSASSNTICAGGTVTLTATGTGANSYTWNPSGSSAAINVVTPGATTTFTAYGSNGTCTESVTVTVFVNPTPTVSIGASASSFCTPACVTYTSSISGSIIQSYGWSLDNGLTSGLANPSTVCYPVGSTGANVTLSITDVVGCTATATTSIIINPTPSATLVPGNVRCNGLCNGAITFSVSGGTTPYMYLGTMGNPTQPVQNNLCAGNYTCFVQDANNCTDTVTVSITEPPALTLTVNQTNVSCNGACDGTATLNVSGGTPAYTYSWSGLGNQPVASGACAGTYTCNVTDANGCRDSTTTTIAQPTPIVVIYTLMQDTAPHVWDIYPSFTGGTQPYTYSWNWGDGNTSNTAYPSHTYSVAGTYSICVTVTDASGCSSQTYCQSDSVYRMNSSSTMITVDVINGTAPTGIKNISTINAISIYPNPAQNNFTIETNLSEKQMLFVFDVNGKLVLNQFIQGKTTIDASNLSAGVYSLNITNTQGTLTKKLVIVK